RIAQRLNVRDKVRLTSSLAAASLDGLFEHPAEYSDTFQEHPPPSVASVLINGSIGRRYHPHGRQFVRTSLHHHVIRRESRACDWLCRGWLSAGPSPF